MKVANDSWTLVSTAPASIVLQNTGNTNILLTLAASKPTDAQMPNLEASDSNKIEALQLLPGTPPQRLTGLDTLTMNVYARAYGTSRASAIELAFFEGV